MTKKASGLLLALFCFTIPIVRAQSPVFISATASVNPAEAGSAIDGNAATAWVLSPGDLQQDQYLLLALQKPGNVTEVRLETNDLSARTLKKMLSLFVTYDPMNPGAAIDYSIKGSHPSVLTFAVKTRVMELKDFQRITLAPGESKEVSFTLTPYQLSLLNDHMDRVVEPGQFRIMIGGKSPSYTAADRIKNSVGYRSAAEGVNDSLDYTAAYKADFFLTPGSVEEDTVHHQKRVGVTVTNKGNLTDVGTVTMYVDGVQQEEVHHFELGAGQAKQIWFVPEGKGTVDCIFITKYRSATGRYTL